jgi:hypothetical protein
MSGEYALFKRSGLSYTVHTLLTIQESSMITSTYKATTLSIENAVMLFSTIAAIAGAVMALGI